MRTFTLTDEQIEEIKEWDKCANKYHGAIGGHLEYSFIPNSIGEQQFVKCLSCKKTLDITNYGRW
jgi:hypothetical protein